MSLLIAENVDFSYGSERLLSGASFTLTVGGRVGLLGPNGCGKSTLLRLLLGELSPLAGQIHRRRELTLGYLPQDPPAPTRQTLRQAATAVFDDLLAMETQLHELAEAMGDGDAAVMERYEALQAEFEAAGGYDIHQRVDEVLTGLNFTPAQQAQPLAELSGGQRTRAHLACLLLRRPDLLLLDEPTNHLDLPSVEWLEEFLTRRYAGGLVVVSHDRWFLDRVTTTTWEIASRRLETYKGGYSDYLTLRAERLLERQRLYDSQQDYIRKTREFIAKFISGQRTKEAQGRRTRLERFMRDEAIDPPENTKTIHLKLAMNKRPGTQMLRAADIAAGYDEPLVTVERLEVQPGQRIAMIGPNGAGKTTLLRTLLGELPALGGDVVFGSNVEVGYLSQTHAELDTSQTVLQAVHRDGLAGEFQQVRDVLGALRFSGPDAEKPIAELSGGQRSRVVLARLALQNANLLVLDEPTNHLDMDSVEILQEALLNFPGAVLFVSHDRRFIQAVATDMWVLENQTIKALEGNWDDYLAWRARQGESGGPVASGGAAGKNAPSQSDQTREQKKADYKAARKQANRLQRLRRAHEALEKEIFELEAALEDIKEQMSDASQFGEMAAVEQLAADYQTRDAKLKTLWVQWETMGEELEAGGA